MCRSHHESVRARQGAVVISGRTVKNDIIALALGQNGCVTRIQLLTLGVASATIADWVRSGWLFRVHAGAYAVGRPLTTPVERATAAVLACGPDAHLSHFSALAAWGLAPRWPATLEVTVGHRRRRPGIVTAAHPRDPRRHQGPHAIARLGFPS